jgi:DNA polymerase bacteriophage-type
MRFITLDFETFFADDYQLKGMTTESYIRDKRFEAHGASIKWDNTSAAQWYDEAQLRYHLKQEDWSDVAIITHHAHFDGLILNHHYNVRPKLHVCTLSMARLLLGNHLSVSLDSVRTHFGMPSKRTPYHLFKGKHWRELTPDVQHELAEGCNDEVESIFKIFATLARQFPREEFDVVDTTVRMFTEPVLRADVQMLLNIWRAEETNKKQALEDLNVTAKDLGSNERFTAMLEAEGIEVPTKPGKNGPIPPFAKTDEFMTECLEHENDRVRALASARLGQKSSLVQTRAETLGYMANRGPLCVYLRYAAAHTSRWGGGDKSNFQNLVPRIAKAIVAPEGYLLASPDCSQIECRLLNYLAGQEDVVEAFRQNRDVYAEQASRFHGREITKQSDPEIRQVFKVVELQAGYGSGGKKIRSSIYYKSKAAGFDIDVTDAQGEELKNAYREQHPFVQSFWRRCDEILPRLADGSSLDFGLMRVENRRIVLPNGIPLIYDTLEWHTPEEVGKPYWRIKTRKGWEKTYGAKLTENWIQALARLHVSQAMTRIKKLGYKIFNTRHDDIGILIPGDGKEQKHLLYCIEELRRPPDWLPNVPLDAEGDLNTRYVK